LRQSVIHPKEVTPRYSIAARCFSGNCNAAVETAAVDKFVTRLVRRRCG
jgi:hypothetical protein